MCEKGLYHEIGPAQALMGICYCEMSNRLVANEEEANCFALLGNIESDVSLVHGSHQPSKDTNHDAHSHQLDVSFLHRISLPPS